MASNARLHQCMNRVPPRSLFIKGVQDDVACCCDGPRGYSFRGSPSNGMSRQPPLAGGGWHAGGASASSRHRSYEDCDVPTLVTWHRLESIDKFGVDNRIVRAVDLKKWIVKGHGALSYRFTQVLGLDTLVSTCGELKRSRPRRATTVMPR